eukprot:SAG22_NODE_289_length_12942_cov_6.674531_3_plen_214_part_00
MLALTALQAMRRALPTYYSGGGGGGGGGGGDSLAVPPPAAASPSSSVWTRYVSELESDDAATAFVDALRYGTGGADFDRARSKAVLDDEWRGSSGRPSAAVLPQVLAGFTDRGGVESGELRFAMLQEAAELLRQLPPRALAAALQRERVQWQAFEEAISGGEPSLARLHVALAPLADSGGGGGSAQHTARASAPATSGVGGAMRSLIGEWRRS